ncbi:stage II sporulation protein P [Desulfitispora alkaliphila]|uniref:stage II sporulation protein P n=1 Tax=Desulfitispora alkaliphila TaxID=622674 RepID=UPI003D24C827
MNNLPIGLIILTVVAALVYLGIAQRVLDKMRLSDRAAFVILALIILGSYLEPFSFGAIGLQINLGGALVPIGVALYLITTADERREKVRATIASLGAAAGILFFDKVLPIEPGALAFDIDSLFLPAIIAAGIAYALGRSRRASFAAGVLGIVLVDIAAAMENAYRGLQGVPITIGGAGLFDAVLLTGVLAVVIAEVVGEIYERITKYTGVKWVKPIALISLAVMVLSGALLGGASIVNMNTALIGNELSDGSYFRLIDNQNNVLLKTARNIRVGDKYIGADNIPYRVVSIQGLDAIMEEIEEIEFIEVRETQLEGLWRFFTGDEIEDVPQQEDGPSDRDDRAEQLEPVGPVIFYHTHNAESFVSSDGTHSIYGKGGIHEVGSEFKKSLEELRVTAVHAEDLHLPHDRGAYRRSRRTVSRLLEKDPELLFDIHRDAAPQQVYAEKVDGTWVTQVLFVVGRQNQNKNVNLDFARELKAVADEVHPDLVKGILVASGNYNQDMFPRSLLLEVGSHTNARESAERGIALFSEVVREYLDR